MTGSAAILLDIWAGGALFSHAVGRSDFRGRSRRISARAVETARRATDVRIRIRCRLMHIALHLDPSRYLRWHQWLAAALSDTPGCRVSLVFAATAHPLPLACRLTLELEHLIYGRRLGRAMARADPLGSKLPEASQDEKRAGFDVVIDLAGGSDPPPRCGRLLTLLFNSIPGEIGAIAAIFNDCPVRIEAHDSAFCASPLVALPATADPRVLTVALDAVLSRGAELILKALCRPAAAASRSGHWSPNTRVPSVPACAAALARVTRVLSSKFASLLGRLATGGHAWAVAYRFNETASLLDGRAAIFAILRDDTRRYYADPFPFGHRGQHYIFVEEFSFAKGRGCISVAALDANGVVSTPRAIIEEPHHLSYPFVFAHDGQIWMIPESGAANRIDLYRATQFPYCWKREGTLVEGFAGHDATLLRRRGRIWLFASLTRWRSTSWDNLSIFHAKNLTDPWVSHAQNPVLLDARRCRAGGALFRHGGQLLRPVQDCSRVYGGAVIFNRVDILNETDFQQTEVGRIETSALGCHTYNRQAGLETLDIFDAARRLNHVTASCALSVKGAEPNMHRHHDLPEPVETAATATSLGNAGMRFET
jgi:hypothetical protein